MSRITKAEIEGMMKRLCLNLNQKLTLDYNAIYGGYKITIIEENGGEYHPIGEKRLGASEFYTALHMCNCALELKERGL